MKRIFLLVAALMLMLSSTAFADKGAITFIGRQSRHKAIKKPPVGGVKRLDILGAWVL